MFLDNPPCLLGCSYMNSIEFFIFLFFFVGNHAHIFFHKIMIFIVAFYYENLNTYFEKNLIIIVNITFLVLSCQVLLYGNKDSQSTLLIF